MVNLVVRMVKFSKSGVRMVKCGKSGCDDGKVWLIWL